MKTMSNSNYDFKNAPEGATHYNPEAEDVSACWVKIDGSDVYFQYAHNLIRQEWRWWFSKNCKHSSKEDLLSSFIKLGDNEEWKDGIPQVGTVCEAWYSARRGWCEAEVLKVDTDEYDTPLIAFREVDTDYLFWSSDFRAIKTAEEIATEEAAKKVEEERDKLVEFFINYYGNPKGAESYLRLSEALVKQGWKND